MKKSSCISGSSCRGLSWDYQEEAIREFPEYSYFTTDKEVEYLFIKFKE